MSELIKALGDKIKVLGSEWTKYTVVASFALYLLGYLTLRFHLTSMGLGTDLAVLDERYLFTGARCLVYLVSCVPNIVLVAGPIVAVVYGILRLVPGHLRRSALAWWSDPARLAVTGIAVAVLLIQFVMRRCFQLSNLLLATELPAEPAWLSRLLLDEESMPSYFSGLVAGCTVTAAIAWAVSRSEKPGMAVSLANALLLILVVVQFLLLPINFGYLVVDKWFARVSAVAERPVGAGEEAWLVWEGKDGMTWLVRRTEGGSKRRSLVWASRAAATRIEITGYDPIFRTLFADRPGQKP